MIGKAQLERLWGNLAGLGPKRLAVLAIVGTTVFSAIALGSYYLSRPDFETLYGGLSAQDVSRIGAVLKDVGIAFDVNAEGNKVLVRVGQTAPARMLLAERGLPGNSNSGYELFDKLGPMSLTSFMQEITRVRALEGEIARTIQVMKGVKAARVHLVLPDTGSFRRNKQQPSASVVIHFDGNSEAASGQAVRHLVAAAVPGLNIDQVTVLNANGTILASGSDQANAAPGKMVELEKTIAKDLSENVRRTLAPYLGPENFEVSVTARLNIDKRQVNETAFDPESKVERSVRVVKESGSSQNQNSRTPAGVEQNLPAESNAGGSGDQSKRANERREELTNFELSSKSISTTSEGYKVEALTIAVVINRKRLLASLGAAASPDELDKQVKELERLAGSAAGIDLKRGDRISVAAVDFLQNTPLMEPAAGMGLAEILAHQTGSLVRAATILAMTFLLVWFGLRPLSKLLIEPAPAVAAAALSAADPAPPALAGQAKPSLLSDLTAKLSNIPQKRLEEVVELGEEQAAAILKQWMRRA